MSAADISRRFQDSGLKPAAAAAVLAELIAAHLGGSLRDANLPLLDSLPDTVPDALAAGFGPDRLSPDLLGEVYERLLADDDRHQSGVHYTPREVAEGLVAAATDQWPPGEAHAPLRILDPSVGGGAFLLATARWRHEASGLSRRAVCAELIGRDINATALAVAQAALALWCVEGGEEPGAYADLRLGDIFVDPLPAADLIIGNPPFLSQLDASTAQAPNVRDAVRERFAVRLGPYADTASVFLLAGQVALADQGRMVLIQPVSFLASRDVEPVRERLAESSQVRGLWFCAEELFEASVRVCAPVVAAGTGHPDELRRWSGQEVAPVEAVPLPGASSWGPAVADLLGIPMPRVQVRSGAPNTVGDLATATAGFRDQFYGFAPLASEQAAGAVAGQAHLITTGMVDPLRNRWGTAEFRFAKQRWLRPVVDLRELEAQDPTLAAWTQARLRPKLLVATQTKVVEVAVDGNGTWIPVTPLVSVEPNDADDEDALWRLAAVLSAPAISAQALAQAVGSALMVQAIKLSATQITQLPLPADEGAWAAGAGAAKRASAATDAAAWNEALQGVGKAMSAAYGSDDSVLAWWSSRLPRYDR